MVSRPRQLSLFFSLFLLLQACGGGGEGGGGNIGPHGKTGNYHLDVTAEANGVLAFTLTRNGSPDPISGLSFALHISSDGYQVLDYNPGTLLQGGRVGVGRDQSDGQTFFVGGGLSGTSPPVSSPGLLMSFRLQRSAGHPKVVKLSLSDTRLFKLCSEGAFSEELPAGASWTVTSRIQP